MVKSRQELVFKERNQAILQTPYGKGLVVRTRRNASDTSDEILMNEIELLDWARQESSNKKRGRNILFSPITFPSISPEVGHDVLTTFGRGKIIEVRDDGFLVVKISSWRLTGRSAVTCFLSRDSVTVVKKHEQYEMSTYEKVEYAQHLKTEASEKFSAKQYSAALELYAKAVDAVRYVQHTKNSSNELRADLLVVMITCCNNAGTCCLQLKDWERASKFGKNALVLLQALYEKKGSSKIHKLLNHEGLGDPQLFGAWRAKSYLIIGRGQAERHSTEEAIDSIKAALDVIEQFKKEGDAMFQQLLGQEKAARKLMLACKARKKAEKKKAKQRAVAMFGGSSENSTTVHSRTPKRPDSPETTSDRNTPKAKVEAARTDTAMHAETAKTDIAMHAETAKTDTVMHEKLQKRVSFIDGSIPGEVDDNEDQSFFENHKEALIVTAGLAIGSFLINMSLRRKN